LPPHTAWGFVMRHARLLVGFLVLGFVGLGCRSVSAIREDREADSPEPVVVQAQAQQSVPSVKDNGQRTTDNGRRTSDETLLMRCRYADLLLSQKQIKEARQELELFIADAQEMGDAALKHLIHSHSRLMEIAQEEDDEYAEHLHRGIGLCLLARQRAALPDPDGELSCESLLCKAAGELAVARRLRPGEARPCWYLYLVWTRLAQRHPAQRWLNASWEAAPLSFLTPCELRSLQLARRQDESRRQLVRP
jgi:hypothetical protein